MNGLQQLDESLSWRLITELLRRHPNDFFLIETHPGGGQYDCLSLWYRKNGEALIDLNRGGSLHLYSSGSLTQSWSDWRERMLTDPKAFLDALSSGLRLPVPVKLSKTTSVSLVFRFVADFLSHAIGGKVNWQCRNGFCDSSGWDGGPALNGSTHFQQSKLCPRLSDIRISRFSWNITIGFC